jgi:hypothetical protein
MRFSFLIGFAYALLPLVAAHGSVTHMDIDGKRFEGPKPGDQDLKSPVRVIRTASPVKGANNPAMNCGQDARPAALVADANPGSRVSFGWRSGEEGVRWPHNRGPMITYMAACNGPCAQADVAKAKFFKIHEVGQKQDGSWFQLDLFNNDDATVDMTLPNNLPAGEYLIRHEIIALHLGGDVGGAEFYPSCSQIRLSAPKNPSTASLPTDTVTFPGGYSDNDPGILVNVFAGDFKYTNFPGPAVIADVPSSSSPNANNGLASGTATSRPATSTIALNDTAPTTVVPSKGGSCSSKKRRSVDGAKKKRYQNKRASGVKDALKVVAKREAVLEHKLRASRFFRNLI